MQNAQKHLVFFGTEKGRKQKITILVSEKVCYNINESKSSKGAFMNNILFSLLPKAMCAFVYDDYTIRQALEKMEAAGFAALPILNKRGEYRGTLTEGDLLWALKNLCYMDIRQAEARKIMDEAKTRIQAEKEAALRDVRKEVAQLSVAIAEKVVRKDLSTDKGQMELIDRMIDEVS